MSGPNNNSAFSIGVGNGNTILTHNNSGSFVFNSLTSQNIFLNNVSNTWTSNIGNYNYDFRRSDTNGQNFYIGNSNTSSILPLNIGLDQVQI